MDTYISNRYGVLLNNDIKLHRQYFNEMLSLIGINVLYRSPKKDKHYTTYAEIESAYNEPILTGCIFTEHPDQKTLKKIGWTSELQKNSSLIHVKYDLPDLQQGALFIIPSGLDNSIGRVFRVVNMFNSIIYPASITCEIVPEFENTYDKSSEINKIDSFNLLKDEEDDE